MGYRLKNGIISLILTGVLAAGVCCTGFASRDDNGKWFRNGNISTWHWVDKTDGKADGDTPDDGNDPAKPCAHEYADGSHACTVCGEVSAHEYATGSHACTVCGEVSAHAYADGSHECTVCGEVSAHAYDADGHVCTVCGECDEHRYGDGNVCMYCGGRSLRNFFTALSFNEANEFSKLTTSELPVHAKAGTVVNYVFTAPITATLSEGLKINYTVTSVAVNLSDLNAGTVESIEVTQTETGWCFTVPEGAGSIEVTFSGTVEKELPQGYHSITYNVQDGGLLVGGNWLVFGKSYAKEGDIIRAELVWNSWNEGGSTLPTINNISVSYSSKNVQSYHVFKSEYGSTSYVYFTVGAGDVELVLEIS